MTDDVEMAERRQREQVEDAISKRQTVNNQPSAHYCVDCDDAIPEQRREAVPGVQKCLFCAEFAEKWR